MNLTDPKLAINGGSPVRTAPWQDNITTGEAEKKAVEAVMDSGYLSLFEGSFTPDRPFSFSGGPKVQELEELWAGYYGAKYAVSMNSATSGLYAAIGALELGFGDEVIVSPYTMSACAVAPLIYGAIPIFADVLPETGCLDPASIRDKITSRTKAIMVVHQFGMPAIMDEIMAIAREHGLKVIEDCAQAHGATYRDRYVGTFGDIGVFSLNVNKSIQTGEGAVVVTDSTDLKYRLELIRNHAESVVGPAGYEQLTNMIGFNYRLTELQAAIGIVQLKKLDELNRIRLELVDFLKQELGSYDFIALMDQPDSHATYYQLPFRFLPSKAGISRKAFIDAVNAEGILFFQGYVKPLYLLPVFRQKLAFKHGYPFNAPENQSIQTNYEPGACPNVEQLHFEELVSNEHIRYPHTLADMEDIVKAIRKVAGD